MRPSWQRACRAPARPPARYAELLETQSDHQLLPPERLAELLASVREVVTRAGGRIEVDFVCRLVLARHPGG